MMEGIEQSQDDERVVTKSHFTNQSSTSTPKFPGITNSQSKSNNEFVSHGSNSKQNQMSSA
jgi:ankyrin repeat protein